MLWNLFCIRSVSSNVTIFNIWLITKTLLHFMSPITALHFGKIYNRLKLLMNELNIFRW